MPKNIINKFKTSYGVSTPQEEGSGGSAPLPPETPEQSSEVFSNKNNYDEVADIYDVYNTANYDIDFFIERYKNFNGNAIELMAGTGRISLPLIRTGLKLDCIDISIGLLDKLERKLKNETLTSNLICQDIRFLNLEKKYDLAIIGFNSIAEIINYEDQKLVFNGIKNFLNKNGEFIFTLYNPNYRRKLINNNLSFIKEFNFEDKKLLFFMSSRENEDKTVDIKQYYEIHNNNKELLEKKVLDLKFKLIDKNEIESLISETGFKIKEIYGDFNLSEYNENYSPFMIYSLKVDE
ncbi:MAG: class I SAM-dependent methyltransferase [Candidatus Sericytochromatia bacterium]